MRDLTPRGRLDSKLHVRQVFRTQDLSLTAPIVLALVPGEQLILQSLIDQWHTQASVSSPAGYSRLELLLAEARPPTETESIPP